jgi:hypothetical protein
MLITVANGLWKTHNRLFSSAFWLGSGRLAPNSSCRGDQPQAGGESNPMIDPAERRLLPQNPMEELPVALCLLRRGARRLETSERGLDEASPPPLLCGKSVTGERGARARKSSNLLLTKARHPLA